MTNVSGVNKENQIVVSGDIARHYGNLAKQYRDESEAFCNSAKENAEIVASKIGEINNLVDSSIQNISNAQTIAVNAVDNQSSIAISNINLEADDIKADLEEYKSSVDTEKTNSITEIKTEGAEQINNIKKTGFYIHNDKLYYIDSNGESQEFGGGGGLEVCDIGMALFVDETKGLRRRLNGQIVDANINTQDFIDKLVKIKALVPSLFDTEENWQAIKSASKLGQCGKFVFNYSGVKIVSVRIPAIVNINGLVDMANAGLIKNESLPNIRAFPDFWTFGTGSNKPTGALYSVAPEGENYSPDAGTKLSQLLAFDASRSSSVYQDNAPVQQEAIQYPYFIQIATGQETEVNIKDTLELNNPFTFGMNTYFKGEMENISWLKSANQQNPKALCPDFYDWILTNANAGKDGFKLSTASDITDYDFVINTTDETFRLPLKNGQEGVFANGVNDTTVPTGYNLYYFVGVVVKNPNLIDAGRIAENIPNMANRNLSNLSDFGKIMCAKNAFAQIHYDPNDFSKIGAYWAVQNLTSGSVNIPAGGLWLTFVYKYNANTKAELIGSAFEVGIVLGGTKFEVTGSYPHYYFHGIRIQEA